MFYSNKEVSKKINKFIDLNGGLGIITKVQAIQALNNKTPVSVFYFEEQEEKSEILPIEDNTDIELMRNYTMHLRQLTLYPFGSMLWSDDKTIQILSEINTPIDLNKIDLYINNRLQKLMKVQSYSTEMAFVELLKQLNK